MRRIAWKQVFTGPTVAAAAVLAVGLAVLLGAVQGLGMTLRKAAVEPGTPMYLLDEALGAYRKAGDVKLSRAFVDEMGTERYVFRTYRKPGEPGKAVRLLLAYHTGVPDATPHIARRLFSLSGARGAVADRRTLELPAYRVEAATRRKLSAAADDREVNGPAPGFGPAGGLRVPVTLMRGNVAGVAGGSGSGAGAGASGDGPVAGYLFVANGRLTERVAAVRRRVSDLRADRAYWCRIEIVPGQMRGERFHARRQLDEAWPAIERFLREALPGIMAMLPDWEGPGRAPGGGR